MRYFIIVFGLLVFLFGCKKEKILTENPIDNWVFNPTPYELNIPAHFPLMDIPEDNLLTEQGVALGRRLYYDSLMHVNSKKACASCHLQSQSFTSLPDVLPHINLGWNQAFLWNGKVVGNVDDIMLFEVEKFFQTDFEKLNEHELYPKLFYEAFGTDVISAEYAGKALSQFVRTLISSNSKYDKVLSNQAGVFFTDAEYTGYELFNSEDGDCFHCHGGILFTDNLFHNNGLDTQPSETGLSAITNNPDDLGKYKAPTLRNLAFTAPYMHDGRFQTLEEVIDFYSEGLQNSPTVDPLMKNVHQGGVLLTDYEKECLLAFLLTLTDTDFTINPEFSSPFGE
ncbi:MAG: cytochrome-c peroxidase [Bacteroidetes bacterium]|nr:cytochrome-c peroxidase [Bacteroidota bacterium]